jgi:hypothetical protein
MLNLRQNVLLTALFTLLVLMLLFASVPLSRPAALVPVTVLFPTLILLAAQLVLDLAPELAAKWSRVFPEDALGARGMSGSAAGERETRTRSRSSEGAVLAWLLMVLGSILLVGLAPALPLFTFAYLRCGARERWRISLSMAVGTWVVLHAMFTPVLGGRLYHGLLWAVL